MDLFNDLPAIGGRDGVSGIHYVKEDLRSDLDKSPQFRSAYEAVVRACGTTSARPFGRWLIGHAALALGLLKQAEDLKGQIAHLNERVIGLEAELAAAKASTKVGASAK
jgi:hypothetical protein